MPPPPQDIAGGGTSSTSSWASRSRKAFPAGLLGALLLVSYAWFYQGGGWNQNSRLDLVWALVERGSPQIDAYVSNTGDYALREGHYYSDKAPGAALVAVPAVAALRAAGVEDRVRQSYVATLVAASLPTAAAAVLLYQLLLQLGASRSSATLAALAFGLGTPAWSYATMLFGHALAAFCLTAALAGGVALGRNGPTWRSVLLGLAVGLSAGGAVAAEYPTAPAAVLLVLLALARAGQGRALLAAASMLVGAAMVVGPLGLYHRAAFGAALQTGYSFQAGFPALQQGFLGITRPDLGVLGHLLVHPYRGLIPASPVLLPALLGLALGIRSKPTRGICLTGWGVFLCLLLINASYAYWHGGWAYGPRHLVPAFPLLCLGLGLLYERAGGAIRSGLVSLALLSTVINLVAVSTNPMPAQVGPGLAERAPALYASLRSPWPGYLWPAFRQGDLAMNRETVLDRGSPLVPRSGDSRPRAAWNLGQVLGLRGLASLAPLLGLWAIVAGV
ncbi:hypothetical protein DYH09_28480, partial [bacterium CPR1]|nr:hypothetical protein [bacterium CPR1]